MSEVGGERRRYGGGWRKYVGVLREEKRIKGGQICFLPCLWGCNKKI